MNSLPNQFSRMWEYSFIRFEDHFISLVEYPYELPVSEENLQPDSLPKSLKSNGNKTIDNPGMFHRSSLLFKFILQYIQNLIHQH